jgi:uncharacterized protein YndB with AHSA1/START domain
MSKKITIQARVRAPIHIVWDKWTTPTDITQWNFASDDWHCPRASVELKKNGKASLRMEAKDGSFGFDFSYTFTDVLPQQLISYVMEDGRTAVTTFTSLGEQVEIQTVFDAEETNSIGMQRTGWQAILNNFKSYVER